MSFKCREFTFPEGAGKDPVKIFFTLADNLDEKVIINEV
jgi:hypothetical protein